MFRSVLVAVCLVTALLLPTLAVAQAGPAGTWIGEMKTPDGEEFEVTLELTREGEVWSGVLSDERMGDVTVENLKVTSTRISFTFKPEGAPFPANFSGSYVAADDRVTGTVSMRGSSRFVKFKRKPGAGNVAVAASAEPEEPARRRHEYHFALTARASYWPALHVVKDENYNLNTLTTAELNFDGALSYYVMDGFSLFVRGYRGGLGITDDPGKLARYEDIGLSGNSYLKLDGWEFGFKGYLGNLMMRNSRFNPYLTAAGGEVDWALQSDGRGSAPIELDRSPLAGKNWAFAAGIGTEYELSKRFMLEFEWLWRYFATEDEDKWADPDNYWSNTHAWSVSLGLTWGFW